MKEEKRNEVIYFSNNTCVSCGKTIPEGLMVCQYCLNKEEQKDNFNPIDNNDLMIKLNYTSILLFGLVVVLFVLAYIFTMYVL